MERERQRMRDRHMLREKENSSRETLRDSHRLGEREREIGRWRREK